MYPVGFTWFSGVYNDQWVGLDELDKDFMDSRVETIQVVERWNKNRKLLIIKGETLLTRLITLMKTVDFSYER